MDGEALEPNNIGLNDAEFDRNQRDDFDRDRVANQGRISATDPGRGSPTNPGRVSPGNPGRISPQASPGRASPLNQNALQSLDRQNQQMALAGGIADLGDDPVRQQQLETRKQYQALLDSGKIKDEKKKQ